MNRLTSVPLRISAVTAATSVIAVAAALPAAAAEDDIRVVNTETVQVFTDATGAVETRRLYEQLALTGDGSVTLSNPVETDGLRNLDGFGGFDVEDGNQIAEVSVDGEKRLRTVSDYTGDLPLDVSVKYYLDGELVEPGDVVGEAGKLEVMYTVRNVTGVEQEVTFDDGTGGTITKPVEVPIPMVGSLTTIAPPNFTNVKSKQANMAGDGKGGTKLSFTMTLFPPIGSDTAEFGYTANISDGVIPRASISALPVNPLESTSFKTAGESYKGGAETGIELTDGATQIDANLLKLRDGAGELLAGLIQLRDGSEQLEAGLSGEAVPGADRLAAGAGELSDGLGQIDDGAGQLADGAGAASDGGDQVADGAGRLAAGLESADAKAPALLDGLDQLRAGLVKVDNGLRDLSKGVGGIRNNPKYQALLDGLDTMLAGIGSTGDPGTLTWGVDQVRAGLTEAVPGVDLMIGGTSCASTVIGAVVDGHGPLPAGVHPCFPDGFPGLPPLDTTNLLELGRATLLNKVRDGLTDPANVNPNKTLLEGLNELKVGLTSTDSTDPGAIAALTAIECALDNTSLGGVCDAVRPGELGLRQGLTQVAEGVPTLVNTIIATVRGAIGNAADVPEDKTLRGGMSGLIDGSDRLSAGGADLIEGLGLLSEGAGQLSDGSGELADGLGELEAGAGQLADGTGRAADGAGQVADGAGQLADGLKDAANGTSRLSDGLGKAAAGAPKLEDGAQRLSDEGTKKLVEAGEATAQNYGELYAVIEAGAERADAEKMVYGAPEGAIGLAAYSYEIKGEDGEGGRNMARGLGGLAVLAASAGAFALRRRFI